MERPQSVGISRCYVLIIGFLRFGPFELDATAGRLLKSGIPIKLQPQPLSVLVLLIERAGHVVTREEIQQYVWGDSTFVDFEHGINFSINQIRRALCDGAEKPRYIETVPRRGYRFIAPVRNPLADAELTVELPSRRLFGWDAALAAGGRGKLWRITVPVLTVALLVAGWLYYYSHRQSRVVTERDTVVIADFTNSTGDAIFDDTLKTALNVSLRQSPFLNVLSDNQVAATLQMMTRPATTKLTPELARDLCQRAGSKAYLAGSIGSLGSEYVLGLKAVNCQSGDTLTEEQVTAASKEKVLDALGEAASKLRGELGESLATVQKFDVPLARATTSSLEALKAYSLGWRTYGEKGAAAALPYFQRAINLDPKFAMGYWAVGSGYFGLGELDRASEYYTKAFQLREHASEREKLAITAMYYQYVTGELDKAAQTYQQEIESYPRQSDAYGILGFVYAERGQYEKAAEMIRQAVRLAPDQGGWYEGLAFCAVAMQRFDETRQIIHEAQKRKLDDYIQRQRL